MKREDGYFLLILFAVLLFNTEMSDPYYFEVPENLQISFQEDINEDINIDFVECCSYIEEGYEKSCVALAGFSCDYCNSVC